MSLAWKWGVTVVLFLVAAVAAVILVIALLGTPPTVEYASPGPGQPVNVTLQTVGSVRVREPSGLGVLHGPVAPGSSGCTPPCSRCPSTPGST